MPIELGGADLGRSRLIFQMQAACQNTELGITIVLLVAGLALGFIPNLPDVRVKPDTVLMRVGAAI